MEQKDFILIKQLGNSVTRRATNIKIEKIYNIWITEEKYKNIKDLLSYIPPIYQKYFKYLLKTQNPISEGWEENQKW